CYNKLMELQANDNVCEEVGERVEILEEVQQNIDSSMPDNTQNDSSSDNIRAESKKYGKKFSAKVYKYFSLLTFFIYYLNFMLRIGMRCSSYFKEQGITTFSVWWSVMTDKTKWAEIGDAIFDWYTITLLVFLFLYSVVFIITFIRFSPKHKKTFKYFKKGFVMARRVIKLISVGLTLTVLVNSAQLATFSDKFMFVISLLSILFTVMQICVSVTTWVIGKKLNRSVKQYVGNVMSNYLATARVRPQNIGSGKSKATVGDRIGRAKDRFLRTIETLTLTNDEAMSRAAELDGYVVDNNDITDRFENDYQPSADENIVVEEPKKKSKRAKHNIKKDKRILTKREKPSIIPKKAKIEKHNNAQEQQDKAEDDAQVASDILQESEQNKENHESIT
ncbi:MAG: 7TM-DISM domain-containing protein, partial [Clostridia bacterium]|nr:7TM-DISM domain-containing protein [Clostridia bacterium]